MPALSDLALTIQSRYPFIAVETSEEDRPGEDAGAGRRRSARAVLRVDGDQRPAPLWVAERDVRQPAAPEGPQRRRRHDRRGDLSDDLAPAFGHDRRVIVLSAVKVELPAELEPLTARVTLPLPDADELRSVVGRVVAECSRTHPVSMGLSSADLERFVGHLRGFTAFEAERAIAQAILRDNTLDARTAQRRRFQAAQGYTAFSRGVEVTSAMIVDELNATKPLSVTRAESIEALRAWARDRTMMAS